MKDLAEFDPNLIIKSEIKIEEENVPLPAVPDNPSDSVNVPQKPKKSKNLVTQSLPTFFNLQKFLNFQLKRRKIQTIAG